MKEENHLICNDGTIATITTMYGVGGEETDDPAEAVAIILRMPDGKWRVVQCPRGLRPPHFAS